MLRFLLLTENLRGSRQQQFIEVHQAKRFPLGEQLGACRKLAGRHDDPAADPGAGHRTVKVSKHRELSASLRRCAA